jgi:hypothetical protein
LLEPSQFILAARWCQKRLAGTLFSQPPFHTASATVRATRCEQRHAGPDGNAAQPTSLELSRGDRWNPPARPSRPFPGHQPIGTWECATAGTRVLDEGSWGGPLPPPGRPPACCGMHTWYLTSRRRCFCCRHHAGLCFHRCQDWRLRLHGRRARGAAPARRRPPRCPHAHRVRAQEGCRFHQGGCCASAERQQQQQQQLQHLSACRMAKHRPMHDFRQPSCVRLPAWLPVLMSPPCLPAPLPFAALRTAATPCPSAAASRCTAASPSTPAASSSGSLAPR